MPGQHDRMRLVGERVAGEGVLELGHHADLARPERLDRLLGLAGEPAEMADPLAAVAARVVDLAVGAQRPRVDAEDGELAHVRVRDRLEHHRAERRLGIGGAPGRGLGARLRPLHLRRVGGRREFLHDEVEQRRDPDAARGRAWPGSGTSSPDDDRPAQRGQHLRLADRAFLQVLREQVVVGLGGGLDQLLAVGLRGLDEIGRDLGLLDLAVGQHERPHRDQVHHSSEAVLGADRELQRHEPALQPLLQRLERAEEVGPLAIEPVHHDRARQREVVGELPDLLGLDLHARHRVHHHHRGARHPQARARVGHEVAVAGGVDEVEPVALVVGEADRGVQRDLALDLVGVEVGGRGPVVHTPEPGAGSACEQDRLDQGGLAHAAVANECDIANLGDVHAYLLGRKKDDAVSCGGDATTALRGLPAVKMMRCAVPPRRRRGAAAPACPG